MNQSHLTHFGVVKHQVLQSTELSDMNQNLISKNRSVHIQISHPVKIDKVDQAIVCETWTFSPNQIPQILIVPEMLDMDQNRSINQRPYAMIGHNNCSRRCSTVDAI